LHCRGVLVSCNDATSPYHSPCDNRLVFAFVEATQ
jgi:hypothetical protein